MAEGFIRLGHLVSVFALFHGGAAAVDCIQQFTSEAFFHRVLIARARGGDQPTDGQGFAALGADFDGYLIGGTTHTARANLDGGFDVVQSFVEHLDRGALDLVFDTIKGVVHDLFRDRFLTIDHQVVHELRKNPVAILGVGQDFTFFSGVTTGHLLFLLLRTLGAVFRAALLPILDALRVKHTAQDVVAHTGKVFHTAATDQDNRVFLKVVAFTGDIADDLETVGQAHLGNLTHGRVRLFRRRGIDARADPTLLRAPLQVHGLLTSDFGLPRFTDQLLDRWHWVSFPVLQHMCLARGCVRLNFKRLV